MSTLTSTSNSFALNQLRGVWGVMRSFSAYYTAICALFLLFASQHVQAQDIDSLYAVFSASRGQARIGAANEIVRYCYEKEHIDSLITLKTTDEEGYIRVTVHDAMGGYFMYEKENYLKSIEFLKLSLAYYEATGQAELVNLQKNNIGANYARLGDYEQAAAYKTACYEWEKSAGDSIALSSTLNDLGVIYSQWQKPEQAIRFFEEAERVERPLDRPLQYANRLAQLAREYVKTDSAHRALQLIEEAFRYDEKIESPSLKENRIATHQSIMGDIYVELNDLAKAADSYLKALDYFEKNELHYYIAATLLQLGQLHIKAKRYDEAVAVLQRCEAIAAENQYLRIQRDACMYLGETYNQLLHPNSISYFYINKYTVLNDSIFKETTQQQINDFQVKYETAEKELEIARQQAEIERHRRRITLLIIIAASLTAFAAVLLVAYRKIRRKNIAITRRIVENRRVENLKAATPENRKKTPENALFLKIEQYLHTDKRYLDENTGRTTLAEKFGTNAIYIAKAIKDCTGMTFIEYINSLRLAHACDLLSDPGVSTNIENIAFDSGFNNRFSFYRCFVEKYDISPKEFRKLAQK